MEHLEQIFSDGKPLAYVIRADINPGKDDLPDAARVQTASGVCGLPSRR